MTICVHDFLNQLIHFNSHPHEEDDFEEHATETTKEDFNSHPHEEDDELELRLLNFIMHFNSHPHEEDDFLLGTEGSIMNYISTHILTKRMTEID